MSLVRFSNFDRLLLSTAAAFLVFVAVHTLFALYYLNIALVSVERLVVVSGEGPVESEKVPVLKAQGNQSEQGRSLELLL